MPASIMSPSHKVTLRATIKAYQFRFTPAQLAAWYNERHQVEDILPPEENGMP